MSPEPGGTGTIAALKLVGDYSGSSFGLTEDTTTRGTIIIDPPKARAFIAAMASFVPTGSAAPSSVATGSVLAASPLVAPHVG